MASFFRRAPGRGVILGVLIAAFFMSLSGNAHAAACKVEFLTGQWQHVTDKSRWRFFSNQRVDCRLCKDWSSEGACRYVLDPKDEQGTRQCTWQNGRQTTKIVPDGKVNVTGWEGQNGVLSKLIFSDGTVRDVASTCSIDGGKGIMTIPGLGEFQCHYNYQCNKLEREAR